ncbi:coiled-coil domain-containing protein 80-like [Sinocyclocheilus anshuiensis]|uniref:coiled-coil domain-containing protein 80-like n=1 Tax=Sinocyclocheilus anshuiensis TaxID=1608454 RepID=UPI0007BA0743|nr:PREDICTED: coiled-coil domain-containing protein 80-like [Sinocyclocheilus anshuiensis]
MSRLWIFLLLLAHWINSPVLSAKGGKKKHQVKNQSGPATPKEDVGSDGAPESPSESDFLADFAGKHRLWVITAPLHSDNYLRMMEKQIQESEGLNCRLAERDTLIVTIIQNAMMEGKIQRNTLQGEATVEVMDSEMVSKLLHYLELEDHTFSMLILKKNMRVSERFPYPVRVEAILEVIDQLPVRKLEKVARKGLPVKCKITKKRLVVKKQGSGKRRTFSPQKHANTTSIFLTQKTRLDKKATLRNKVQDILSGRSRFVIRKTTGSTGNSKPSAKGGSKSGSSGNERLKHDDQKKTPDSDRHPESETEVKKASEADKTHVGAKLHFDTLNEGFKGEQTVDHSSSKKKGKGKDGKKKKGKGGRRKSQREADDKEKAALKEFMQNLKGRRRLLVISSPSDVSSQYIKQRDDNELRSCEFSQRKVSVLYIMGSERNPTLHIQHYQQDLESPQASLPEKFRNPELISEIRREYGLDSKNFSMVLTDYDLRPNLNRVFNKPTAPSDLLDYIDNFPSRRSEKEEERKLPSPCSKAEMNNQEENSLLRFMSKRRLLIISAPTVDDYSFHQQLQALNGQECPLGIRHFALLKIVGTGSTASGTVEFFPLNGKSQPEKETLSQDVVESLRNQLKINHDYFSMLVVGKDGDVKAWFPSPMWSLGSIYDLVDSMELRQQEQKLQQTLGIHCPDENTGTYHGYTEETEDSYLYHRSED